MDAEGRSRTNYRVGIALAKCPLGVPSLQPNQQKGKLYERLIINAQRLTRPRGSRDLATERASHILRADFIGVPRSDSWIRFRTGVQLFAQMERPPLTPF